MAHRQTCQCEDCINPRRMERWELAAWSFMVGFAVCGIIWKIMLGYAW